MPFEVTSFNIQRCARFHARLVDAVFEHVKVEGHDDAALLISGLNDCVTDGALIPLDVELDAGWELVATAVVGDGEEGTAHGVEVGDGGSIRVSGGFVGSIRFIGADDGIGPEQRGRARRWRDRCAGRTRLVSNRRLAGGLEEIADVRICCRVGSGEPCR